MTAGVDPMPGAVTGTGTPAGTAATAAITHPSWCAPGLCDRPDDESVWHLSEPGFEVAPQREDCVDEDAAVLVSLTRFDGRDDDPDVGPGPWRREPVQVLVEFEAGPRSGRFIGVPALYYSVGTARRLARALDRAASYAEAVRRLPDP